MRQWIEIAINKAKKSNSHCRVSAIGFDDRGKYLGSARNSFRFCKRGGGIHAEMALLHKFGPSVKTMVICRVGKNGNLKPIHPCAQCQRVLNKLGIKVKTVYDLM